MTEIKTGDYEIIEISSPSDTEINAFIERQRQQIAANFGFQYVSLFDLMIEIGRQNRAIAEHLMQHMPPWTQDLRDAAKRLYEPSAIVRDDQEQT